MRSRERAINLFSSHPPLDFSYDHATRRFAIGTDFVETKNISQYRTLPLNAISEAAAAELVDTSKLVAMTGIRLCIMPTLSRLLLDLDRADRAELATETTEVMRDVYADLSGLTRKNLPIGDLWGFSVNLEPANRPSVHVIGECACLGVTATAWPFSERAWGEGIAQLEFHNADTPVQKASLLAGIGSIAAKL